jgi:hypothetical protein
LFASINAVIPGISSVTIPVYIDYSPTQKPTGQPSGKPTMPTGQPSKQPSSKPSSQPSTQPTYSPTAPSGQPSSKPSSQPSTQPSRKPSMPTGQPSTQPSSAPTFTFDTILKTQLQKDLSLITSTVLYKDIHVSGVGVVGGCRPWLIGIYLCIYAHIYVYIYSDIMLSSGLRCYAYIYGQEHLLIHLFIYTCLFRYICIDIYVLGLTYWRIRLPWWVYLLLTLCIYI